LSSIKKLKKLNYLLLLFRKTHKAYYVRSAVENVSTADLVVAKTERGLEIAEVLEVCDETEIKPDLVIEGKVIRRFSEDDYTKLEELEKKEKEAFSVCVEEIKNLGLPMKLLDVEYLYDGKKAIFYFSAPERIDFRELVRIIAKRLKIRVEMRQVGVRDEAKMIGGLGPCGRDLCCSTFLTKFEPVTINMAKNQGLPLNTFKLSGLCGRLMCCIFYENDNYEEFLKHAPEIEETVETPDGPGRVVGYQFVKCAAEVELESGVRRFYPLHLLGYSKKPLCTCSQCVVQKNRSTLAEDNPVES
jgi:cell fate regulator YaaT (PSP1 superfamily)